MNAWIPKGAPVGGARSVSEYADYEIAACIPYAEEHIEREPHDSAERKRLQEWLRQLVDEKDERVTARRRPGVVRTFPYTNRGQ